MNSNKKIFFLLLFLVFVIGGFSNITHAQNLNIEYPPVRVPGGIFDINKAVRLGKVDVPQLIILIYASVVLFSGVVAFMTLIYAGIVYIVSGGNPGRRKEAFQRFKNVWLGVGILLFSWFILYMINPNIVDLERSLVLQAIQDENKDFTSISFSQPEFENRGKFSCNWSGDTCEVLNESCTEGYFTACSTAKTEEECGGLINVTCGKGGSGGGSGGVGDPGTFDCAWDLENNKCVVELQACNTGGEANASVCEGINDPTACLASQGNACTSTSGSGAAPYCYERCIEEGNTPIECSTLDPCPEIACPVLSANQRYTAYCYDRGYQRHNGHDIMADKLTPIYAMEAGVLDRVAWSDSGGCRAWIIGTASGRGYAHLHMGTTLDCSNAYGPGVQSGASIDAGQLLGYVGTTYNGSANGTVSHLHLTIVKSSGAEECSPPPLSGKYGAPSMDGKPLFQQAGCTTFE